jgi:hypothetical protein
MVNKRDQIVAWGLVCAVPIATMVWLWTQYGVKAAAGLAINWLGLWMWIVWRRRAS